MFSHLEGAHFFLSYTDKNHWSLNTIYSLAAKKHFHFHLIKITSLPCVNQNSVKKIVIIKKNIKILFIFSGKQVKVQTLVVFLTQYYNKLDVHITEA